jgi:hypothetical protein
LGLTSCFTLGARDIRLAYLCMVRVFGWLVLLAIWYWEAGTRQGIYDIRQLLQLADSMKAPRLALLPVILGQPRALSGLLPGPAALPAGGAGHG